MAKQKVKKKSFTPSSQSPRQPPPKDKTNPSSISILGKALVAPVGAHVSAGPSTRKHKSNSATKSVEDIPQKNLASEEDMEEEESSSCDFGSCSNDSSKPSEDDDSVSLPRLQPMVLFPLFSFGSNWGF
ncbi:hypothetical protein OIU78_019394 [Salix suchowensis]|nr:hypothetical protein OIU78_019394 [Salix suchowensis]